MTRRNWLTLGLLAALMLGVTNMITTLISTINGKEGIEANQVEIERIERTIDRVLKNEHVCSETNRGAPCRALFYRIRTGLSYVERRLAACDVLSGMGRYGAPTRRDLRCAPPPGGYPP